MLVATKWKALGTTAEVIVTRPDRVFAARAAVELELARVDRAWSRFREDSELVALNARAGGRVPVSRLLLDGVEAALHAAEVTGGAVDPTVGAALAAAGYDRDFAALPADGPAVAAAPAPGWRSVEVGRRERTVRLPRGTALDLGATGKALAADRAAAAAARAAAPAGVLVNLGGDIAVAGPPPPAGGRANLGGDIAVADPPPPAGGRANLGGDVAVAGPPPSGGRLANLGGDVALADPPPTGGWRVGVADSHLADRASVPTVLVRSGGLATSSVTQRRWRRGGRVLHHILDPATGEPVEPVWRTVSVAAASCLEANTFTTAAIVWGEDAAERLAEHGVAARLVGVDGRVEVAGGWPADLVAA